MVGGMEPESGYAFGKNVQPCVELALQERLGRQECERYGSPWGTRTESRRASRRRQSVTTAQTGAETRTESPRTRRRGWPRVGSPPPSPAGSAAWATAGDERGDGVRDSALPDAPATANQPPSLTRRCQRLLAAHAYRSRFASRSAASCPAPPVLCLGQREIATTTAVAAMPLTTSALYGLLNLLP